MAPAASGEVGGRQRCDTARRRAARAAEQWRDAAGGGGCGGGVAPAAAWAASGTRRGGGVGRLIKGVMGVLAGGGRVAADSEAATAAASPAGAGDQLGVRATER